MYILFSLINVINVAAVLKSTFNIIHGSIEIKDCIGIKLKVEISSYDNIYVACYNIQFV